MNLVHGVRYAFSYQKKFLVYLTSKLIFVAADTPSDLVSRANFSFAHRLEAFYLRRAENHACPTHLEVCPCNAGYCT
jgi:hypothetical protein